MEADYYNIFEPENKSDLPLTHHFMLRRLKVKLAEMRVKDRFSRSARHQSKAYLQKNNHKPITGIVEQEEKSI